MCEELCCVCSRVLKQITSIALRIGEESTDVAHNLSWTGKVFSKIHSILLGSIFSVYHFGISQKAMAEEARRALLSSNLIHPCIAEALHILSEAMYNDDSTYESLLKCCFLVPSLM
jgi:hypothetical protein